MLFSFNKFPVNSRLKASAFERCSILYSDEKFFMFACNCFQNDRAFLPASKQKYICFLICISIIISGRKKVVYFHGDRRNLSNCSWETYQNDQEAISREVHQFRRSVKDSWEFNLHLFILITSHRSRPHQTQRERSHP